MSVYTSLTKIAKEKNPRTKSQFETGPGRAFLVQHLLVIFPRSQFSSNVSERAIAYYLNKCNIEHLARRDLHTYLLWLCTVSARLAASNRSFFLAAKLLLFCYWCI